MQRVIEEMAKAKGDIERRYRNMIPEIIRECMAFAYLGRSFRFDASLDLEQRVNQKLIALGDEIMEDIEARAKRCISYAEEEDNEEAILAYMKREQHGEDLLTRIDKHNSNFRYFLEGWLAIGMVNGLSQTNLLTNIMQHMHNVYVSDLWQKAFNQGYLSDAIRTGGYRFGSGILRDPIAALTELERNSINEAFQYGRFLKFKKDGAIGYTIHRNSSFDCPYCDSFTGIVHPLDTCLLPLHPRCVCYSKPVYGTPIPINPLIKAREEKYKALLNDPNYKDVLFNANNGGLVASHIHHNFDGRGGQYELHVRTAGYNRGDILIFESEWFKPQGEKSTEGTWNGKLFEVAGCETATSSNILNGLKHCAKKQKTEIAVLDFPFGGFNLEEFERSLRRYRGLEKVKNGTYLKFQRIICVENSEVVYDSVF